MDFVIRFIGIVMIVPLVTGPTPTFHALLPVWSASDRFCAPRNLSVEEHRAFIRVNNGQIRDRTGWPERTPCIPSENCTLFEIPVASTIQIDPGFTPSAGVTREANYCRVPNLVNEGIEPSARLRADALSATIADFVIGSGTLEGFQMRTGMVLSRLTVHSPAGASATDITVTARPRDGSAPRTIVIRAGSVINIMNLPPSHAGMELGSPQPGSVATVSRHFLLYHKLLEPGARRCIAPSTVRLPCPPSLRTATFHASPDISCSNGGCCP